MRRQTLVLLALVILALTGCAPIPAPVRPTEAPAPSAAPTVLASPTSLGSPVATASTQSAGTVNGESPQATPPQVMPTPTGEVSASGFLYTTAGGTRRPLPDMAVRLARVVWNADKSDGAFVLEGGTSPTTLTDATGRFTFRNVPPGDYAVIVGDPYATHEIISKPDGKATIYTVTGKGAESWGDIVVSFAP